LRSQPQWAHSTAGSTTPVFLHSPRSATFRALSGIHTAQTFHAASARGFSRGLPSHQAVTRRSCHLLDRLGILRWHDGRSGARAASREYPAPDRHPGRELAVLPLLLPLLLLLLLLLLLPRVRFFSTVRKAQTQPFVALQHGQPSRSLPGITYTAVILAVVVVVVVVVAVVVIVIHYHFRGFDSGRKGLRDGAYCVWWYGPSKAPHLIYKGRWISTTLGCGTTTFQSCTQ